MVGAELGVSGDPGAVAGQGMPPERPLLRLGRFAWAGVGLIVFLALLVLAAAQVAVVVVPLVLALFPAALLAPVVGWLKRHRVPAALASLLSIVGGLGLLSAAIAVLARIAAGEVPDDLVESLSQGVQGLGAALGQAPFLDIRGTEDLGQRLQDMGGGQLPDLAAGIAATAVEVVVGTVFLFVALFFYLDVLEPLVLGRAVKLHPLLVVLVITGAAGATGVLGAFLAVPVTASVARAVDYLRENDQAPA